ncbi:hypothetical protein EJD97_000771 [Solanum chilense]|uniref:Gag-pol polyprotein n=1 Tax=Solanum chilense TaxID=4083 RepID=A0A6N2AQG4_SOLCI|nr:hypothetical protein EJD97_000771 [Solanum chilense]
MTLKRISARRLEEGGIKNEAPQCGLAPQEVQVPQDDQVPPQGYQIPIGGEDIGLIGNALESITTSQFRYFVRINSPRFICSMVGDDPQEFLEGMYKVLSSMRVKSNEKA